MYRPTYVDGEFRIDQADKLERRATTIIVGLAFLANAGARYTCLDAMCKGTCFDRHEK